MTKKTEGLTREEFLTDFVDNWIKEDVLRMVGVIKAMPGTVGNINFPLGLSVLAYMDFLGGFLRGADRDITANIAEYLTCFDNSAEYKAGILADLFRNGLSHDYFARGGISRDGKRPPLYKTPEGQVILDIETLANDFIVSLPKFSAVLTDEQYLKRIGLLEANYHQKMEALKEEINTLPIQPVPPRPLANSAFITTTSTSGYVPRSTASTLPFQPKFQEIKWKKGGQEGLLDEEN
jgi:hypothetical protein